jgi:hypothetical protein
MELTRQSYCRKYQTGILTNGTIIDSNEENILECVVAGSRTPSL